MQEIDWSVNQTPNPTQFLALSLSASKNLIVYLASLLSAIGIPILGVPVMLNLSRRYVVSGANPFGNTGAFSVGFS